MSYEGTAATGIPLIGQGSGNKSKFGTAVIAGGGTNATSFATNLGIVKYDGTSLVTSSTARIDSSNRYTNTSQPAFLANNGSNATNVTGDGTVYTCQFNVEQYDNGSNFAANTFTAPVTGKYLFSSAMFVASLNASHTSLTYNLVTSGGISLSFVNLNPAPIANATNVFFSGSAIVQLTANDTVTMQLTVSGSTKTVLWPGAAIGANPSYFCGELLC
jgi:hypothetical protein